jgi:hypothetical protein
MYRSTTSLDRTSKHIATGEVLCGLAETLPQIKPRHIPPRVFTEQGFPVLFVLILLY